MTVNDTYRYIDYIIQFICILESQVVECSNGGLLYTKILEVNLFAFAYRLFRRDFSPPDGTYCIYRYIDIETGLSRANMLCYSHLLACLTAMPSATVDPNLDLCTTYPIMV